MPRVMAAPFDHITGFHCATTAIRALLRHFGYEMDEALVLGLGMAPNFFYFEGEDFDPRRYFLGRNPTLEDDFFRMAGVDAPMMRCENADESWPPVKALLDQGHPALIQVNVRFLPYFNTSTHFPGHKVLLAGYDEDAGDVFISDSEFPEIQVVTMEQLERSRWHPVLPWDLRGHWWNLREIQSLSPLREAVPRCITDCARRMLESGAEQMGVLAMRRMAKALPAWGEVENWKWCARFGYQVIEKRGTGGGSFRTQYADFLAKTAEYDPRIAALKLHERMSHIASEWTAFAAVLRHISDQNEPHGFDEAGRLFGRITDLEEAFFRDILK